MRYFYYRLCIGLCLMTAMGGCGKEKDPASVYKIEPKLQAYLDLFVSEGKKRGVELELKNLIIEFGKNTDEGTCGTCRQTLSNPDLQRTIIIDTSGICWTDVREEAREALVFHELGHCLLKRLSHKNTTLPNGDLASVMNGQGDMGVYAVCTYDIGGSNGNDCDKRYRRLYYLDELFNENTPVPVWGK